MAQKNTQIDISSRLNRNLGLLHAGAMVTIDIVTPAGQKSKFRTTFIGYLPKQYVLVQFPDANKLGNFSKHIVQGNTITVRGLIEGHEGVIVAFVTKIKQTIQMPSRIMVLSFPQTVTLQNLRSSVRIDTQIVAKIKIDDTYWQTTINNLSINGCHLHINNGEKLILAENKKIEIIVEDFQGASDIKLDADICNIKQLNSGLSFGVKFHETSKVQVTNLLHYAVTLEN